MILNWLLTFLYWVSSAYKSSSCFDVGTCQPWNSKSAQKGLFFRVALRLQLICCFRGWRVPSRQICWLFKWQNPQNDQMIQVCFFLQRGVLFMANGSCSSIFPKPPYLDESLDLISSGRSCHILQMGWRPCSYAAPRLAWCSSLQVGWSGFLPWPDGLIHEPCEWYSWLTFFHMGLSENRLNP